MIVKSIRWRLQAWHGLILVVVLAGFGVTAYEVARENQLRRIDQGLEERAARLLFRPGPRPDNGPPPTLPEGGPGGSGLGRGLGGPGHGHGEGGPGHDGPGLGRDEGGPPDRDFWRAQLCERIKQALTRELGASTSWSGMVYLVLHPARSPDDTITITSLGQFDPDSNPQANTVALYQRGGAKLAEATVAADSPAEA